jgi:hypothetical protein
MSMFFFPQFDQASAGLCRALMPRSDGLEMRVKPLSVKLRAFSCPQGRCRMDHAEHF